MVGVLEYYWLICSGLIDWSRIRRLQRQRRNIDRGVESKHVCIWCNFLEFYLIDECGEAILDHCFEGLQGIKPHGYPPTVICSTVVMTQYFLNVSFL